jgi:hypothetical protein
MDKSVHVVLREWTRCGCCQKVRLVIQPLVFAIAGVLRFMANHEDDETENQKALHGNSGPQQLPLNGT